MNEPLNNPNGNQAILEPILLANKSEGSKWIIEDDYVPDVSSSRKLMYNIVIDLV